MKKLFVVVILIVGLMTALTGCGMKKESVNISDPVESTTLDVQSNDVPANIEPMEEIFLPDEFKRSEYDDKYFMPDTDDFVVITYTTPIQIHTAEWYVNRTKYYEYGVRSEDHDYQSTVKVTYLISYNGDKIVSTKIRTEYKTIDDAMLAALMFDFTICPVEMDLPNEPNDELVTADYFEECDQLMQEEWAEIYYSENPNDFIYYGHHDNFRYYEFVNNAVNSSDIAAIYLCDNYSTLGNTPLKVFSWTAGETISQTMIKYNDSDIVFNIYSSKQTREAGSDSSVLDIIYKLHGDNEYFTPITDDYIYIVKSNFINNYGNEIQDYLQEVTLYSFDEVGNLIQSVERQYNSYFLQEGFEYRSYIPDYSEEEWSHIIFDEVDKVFYKDLLALYGPNNVIDAVEDMTQKEEIVFRLNGGYEPCEGGYYISKP